MTCNVPGIYRWIAQEIPEPDQEEGPPGIDIASEAQVIIHKAMISLLGALGEHFHLAPHDGTSLYDIASEMGQIDRELGRLRSVMLAIKCELGRQVALTCKRRNSIASFGMLPLELVGSILRHTVSATTGPPYHQNDGYTKVAERRNLATVCTGWWHAIQSTPGIWTDIKAEPDDISLPLKLRKSGNLPLNILRPSQYITPRSKLELITAHCQRWQYAQLDLRGEGTLAYARGVFGEGMDMPRLEALSMLCEDLPGGNSPLRLVGGDRLQHLELRSILPESGSPALRTIRRLTLTRIHHTHVSDILNVVASTSALESLVITSIGGREEVVAVDSQFLVRVPTLQELSLKGVTDSFGTALLAGLQANALSSLTVQTNAPSWEDSGMTMFRQLLRPNEYTRRSILSMVIANSSARTINIVIQNDFTLNISGPDHHRNALDIKLLSSQWRRYFEAPTEFGMFDIDLPPIELGLAIQNTARTFRGRPSPWLFNFHLRMPSIASITIGTPDVCARLFQDVLAKEHTIDGTGCWVCPNLSAVRISLAGQAEAWEADVDSALERRARASPTLRNITVWREEDSGAWARLVLPNRSPVDHSHAL